MQPSSIHLASPAALSYLITAPSSLGLARAFVSGELEIEGDLYDALSMLWSERIGQLSWADRLDVLRNLDPKALRWVEPPSEEFGARRLQYGFRHSKARDAEAISHHYDVSNTFYEWVLGPSMTYTCACYPEDDSTLEEAQAHKYDLVARKLNLQAGHAAARRRLRLGRHGPSRREALRRPRARRHAVPPAGRVGREGDRRGRPDRRRRGPVLRLPRCPRDATSTRCPRSA